MQDGAGLCRSCIPDHKNQRQIRQLCALCQVRRSQTVFGLAHERIDFIVFFQWPGALASIAGSHSPRFFPEPEKYGGSPDAQNCKNCKKSIKS